MTDKERIAKKTKRKLKAAEDKLTCKVCKRSFSSQKYLAGHYCIGYPWSKINSSKFYKGIKDV